MCAIATVNESKQVWNKISAQQTTVYTKNNTVHKKAEQYFKI
jgi:hypothetical protein